MNPRLRNRILRVGRRLFGDDAFLQFFAVRQGKGRLNLRRPRRFSEYICSLRIAPTASSEWTLLADKLAVRKVVEASIGPGHLTKLFGVAQSAAEVPLLLDTSVPPTDGYVVKATHGSSWVRIYDPGQRPSQRDLADFQFWLDTDFGSTFLEPHYSSVPRRLLIEERLRTAGGNPPEDYRIHCFHGTPTYIQVDVQYPPPRGQSIYDRDWKHLDVSYGRQPTQASRSVPRPHALGEMLQIAKTLSTRHPYVRVDLYYCKGRIIFGELTFTPKGGLGRTVPQEFDDHLGSLILKR